MEMPQKRKDDNVLFTDKYNAYLLYEYEYDL